MIISLLDNRYFGRWLLFHIVLGLAATYTNTIVILWFYLFLFGTIYFIAQPSVNRPVIIAATIVYLGAFELLARMTGCSPFIPWEAGKYVFTALSVTGLMYCYRRSAEVIRGTVILLLITPSVFIDRSGQADLNDVIFNVLGVVNIGLGILFFSAIRVSISRFFDLVKLIIAPATAVLTYTIIKTPDLDEINFSMGALSVTSGEFGSNQVSTVLGLGFLLFASGLILHWNMTGRRVIDLFAGMAFLVQGLFTFSRGGMVVAGIAFLIFLAVLSLGMKLKGKIAIFPVRYFVPALILIVASIVFVNVRTGGNLLLRYQGETAATLEGKRDRDLSTMTSRRDQIFFSEMELWSKYPLLGSGAGTSKYLRTESQGAAAHVELSRLMAESGILGLVVFLIILSIASVIIREPDYRIRALKMSLFTLAVLTTFHSATRTFVTPLLLSLCVVNVNPTRQIDGAVRRQ